MFLNVGEERKTCDLIASKIKTKLLPCVLGGPGATQALSVESERLPVLEVNLKDLHQLRLHMCDPWWQLWAVGCPMNV